jgi:hypothetical protein
MTVRIVMYSAAYRNRVLLQGMSIDAASECSEQGRFFRIAMELQCLNGCCIDQHEARQT